jgi:hypothetical protein
MYQDGRDSHAGHFPLTGIMTLVKEIPIAMKISFRYASHLPDMAGRV